MDLVNLWNKALDILSRREHSSYELKTKLKKFEPDEKDLNDALNDNLIAGAALDVFSKEPAKENILFNNPKAILTPHIAASTSEASIVVAEMVANQISDFLLNGVKKNTV